jgi:hypothetical protein
MKSFILFAAAIAAVVVAGASAHGRPQPQMFCWTPDVEFPVACEEEEEEDDYTRPSDRSKRPMNGCQADTELQTE